MKLENDDIKEKIELLDGEKMLFIGEPTDFIAYEPIAFAAPFILMYIAYNYYSSSRIFALGIFIAAVGILLAYYLIFKSTRYVITDRRIIVYISIINRMRGMPLRAVENVGMKMGILNKNVRTLILKDNKEHEIQIRAVRQWKEIAELIYKTKYGNDVIVNFQ